MSKKINSTEIASKVTVHMKYAKFIESKQRREDWTELCTRNKDMHIKKYPILKDEIENVYRDFVVPKKVLPSMRSMQFAGKPIEVNNSRIYNCSFLPVDNYHAFSETMFLLLSGTGVGYSVQQQHIKQLKPVSHPKVERKYLIGDSIEGWADAVKELVKAYFGYRKSKPRFDFSDIRAKGERLITSGGKAPGPEPLKYALEKIEEIFLRIEVGQKLTPLDAHDILCHIADAVLAGGIRRSACISMFSKNDLDMLNCKAFKDTVVESCVNDTYLVDREVRTSVDNFNVVLNQSGVKYSLKVDRYTLKDIQETGKAGWWVCNSQRGRANNSVVLDRDISKKAFLKIWDAVEKSRSGEPGFYFSNDFEMGTNPCCEVGLNAFQFCNLTEINGGNIADQEDFNARAKAAAFIGTLQAGYTDFHYLRDCWRDQTEEEALIGVGITGIGDGKLEHLDLKEAAGAVVYENGRVAEYIGINAAPRSTVIKPAGTSSLSLGTASGVHAWHDPFFKRNIRVGKYEAIYDYLKLYLPELIQDDKMDTNLAVLSIPMKAPEGAMLRSEAALTLLERVKRFNLDWVRAAHVGGNNTNNVSCTINVREDEWDEVGEWMYANRRTYNGIAVLPADDHTYPQAPFETCTKEEYERLLPHLGNIDLKNVFEKYDNTDHKAEAACAGGACDVQ